MAGLPSEPLVNCAGLGADTASRSGCAPPLRSAALWALPSQTCSCRVRSGGPQVVGVAARGLPAYEVLVIDESVEGAAGATCG